MENKKKCRTCKTYKTKDQYNKATKNPDGLQYNCRQCQRDIHLANKEYNNQRSMMNYYKNREGHKFTPLEGFKICPKCDEILPFKDFNKSSDRKDGYKVYCRDCQKMDYHNNREYYIKKQKRYYKENKDTIKEATKRYKKENEEWYREYFKKYYQDNKDEIMQRSKEYLYNRMENDLGFKILQRCRNRLYKAIKGYTKSASTQKLIGCTVEQLLTHLENQFTEGMSWDNYGEWHIDHIMPCSSFDFTKKEEQFECFNYKNLQPLWAEDNFRKSDKIGTC